MRLRLTALVAATTTLVLLAFVVPLALLIRSVTAERAAADAETQLRALVPVVAAGDAEALRVAVAGTARPVTVYPPAGAQLGTPAPVTDAVRLGRQGRSRTVATAEGREVVVAAGTPAGVAVLRTVVGPAELRDGVARAWALLALLGCALVGIAVLLADRLARALTAPLTAASAVAHRLAGGDLAARAAAAGPPEVRQVAAALNHLAARIQDLLAAERERLADLSHRLRTPLTALRLESEAQAGPAGARVGALVDDLERAVTGIIHQARRRSEPPGRCDAAAVVRDRVAFWSALAEETGRAVTTDVAAGPIPVAAAADALAAALDALLGNVFAHTPDPTAFTVSLRPRSRGGAVLTVADAGPGLPPQPDAGPVRGRSGAASTGLGLAIAAQTAAAAGGRLTAGAADSGGARVTLELGPPPAELTPS